MISVAVNNLTKRFDKFVAVDSINFSVAKGEIFGFLGPNGAGKSTTIKMLCGILTPTEGSGTVGGFDIVHEQNEIKQTIGYMSQKFSLYNDLTVRENLNFYGSIYGLSGSRLEERIDYVMNMAGIGSRINSSVNMLPGGIKQRLALGTAIIHDPPILFLDEPTSGVDPVMRRNFWDLIYDFSEMGKTIFVTTHYMDEAEHCNRLALIIAGRIIALDTPQNLKSDIPYGIYSIETENFLEMFNDISKLKFVEEAAIFGNHIHILCDKKYNVKNELASKLKSLGCKKYKIEKVPASLEDVFVSHARKWGV